MIVPGSVLAEATTGTPRDARVNAILAYTTVEPAAEQIARLAGKLRHRRRLRRSGTLDALVVATADIVPGTIILTDDVADIRALASETGRSVVRELSSL